MTPAAILVARTAAWSDAGRAALAAVVETLRPSARHLSDILDWLDDIAARDGASPETVLDDARLRAIAASGGSGPERLKRWKERLRRLRYPRLAARQDAVASQLRAMTRPALTITPPPGLEGGVVTVTIRARTTGELADALAVLQRELAAGDVARLFALLDEA